MQYIYDASRLHPDDYRNSSTNILSTTSSHTRFRNPETDSTHADQPSSLKFAGMVTHLPTIHGKHTRRYAEFKRFTTTRDPMFPSAIYLCPRHTPSFNSDIQLDFRLPYRDASCLASSAVSSSFALPTILHTTNYCGSFTVTINVT